MNPRNFFADKKKKRASMIQEASVDKDGNLTISLSDPKDIETMQNYLNRLQTEFILDDHRKKFNYETNQDTFFIKPLGITSAEDIIREFLVYNLLPTRASSHRQKR